MPLLRERPLILFMTLQWLTTLLVLSYRPHHSSAASNQACTNSHRDPRQWISLGCGTCCVIDRVQLLDKITFQSPLALLVKPELQRARLRARGANVARRHAAKRNQLLYIIYYLSFVAMVNNWSQIPNGVSRIQRSLFVLTYWSSFCVFLRTICYFSRSCWITCCSLWACSSKWMIFSATFLLSASCFPFLLSSFCCFRFFLSRIRRIRSGYRRGDLSVTKGWIYIQIQCQNIGPCTREPTPHVTKLNHLLHYNATLVWYGN